MQALTASTIFPCYAAADRPLAQRLASLLERGADVRIFLDEGEIEPGEDLAVKAREGRMADVVIVFFSRHAMPSRWPRAQWEDALVKEPEVEGVRIAFVEKCGAPHFWTNGENSLMCSPEMERLPVNGLVFRDSTLMFL